MNLEVKYSTIIVQDMEHSVEFYRDVMGFEVEHEFGSNGETAATMMKQGDGARIELIQDSFYNIGLYSIAMETDDLDAALAELKEKHVRITMEPTKSPMGRIAYAKDPNGVTLALIEHDKPAAATAEKK